MTVLTTIKDAFLFIALVLLVLIVEVIVRIQCGFLYITKHEPYKLCVSDFEDSDLIEDYDPYAYSE